jgi:hypothetical protein
MKIRHAVKYHSYVKLALAGLAGAGKSVTALETAMHLSTKAIAVIDADYPGAVSKYAKDQEDAGFGFCFDVLEIMLDERKNTQSGELEEIEIEKPFRPQRFLEAVRMIYESGRFDVLVIDGMSSEWDGKGGMLEWVDELAKHFQNRKVKDPTRRAWSIATPEHRKLFQYLLSIRMHVIITLSTSLLIPEQTSQDLLLLSAESRSLFGNREMRLIRTAKVGTDALGKLRGRKQAVGLHNIAFGMDPFGLDWIEPGTLLGQKQGENAHSFALLLDLLIVPTNPGAHLFTVMPGRVVPNQQPGGFASCLQSRAAPVQKLNGNITDRATGHETQRHLFADRLRGCPTLPEHSIASKSFRVRISFFPGLLHQTDWILFALPGIHARQRKTAPPDLVKEADGPRRLLTGPGNQPIACVFFCRYSESGLVIQCFARFQLIFKRLKTRRMLSSETSLVVNPCSKLTKATSSKVHWPRSLPNSCGRRCKMAGNCWAASSEKVVRSWWGREEPSSSTLRPSALKPWITLRTVWSSQPSCRAIFGTRSPRAEASKIWQRRKMKASDERNPAWTWRCSSSVNGRVKMGVLMPSILPHCLPPLVGMH